VMSKAHERVVEAQFGPRAKAYVESAVHSQGADLEAIGALAQNAELALDLGAGGGHVSYALARHARRVIASDLSSEMLAAVARTAREKGLGNIETVEAPAEHLPFEDETFDFVASRFSAHHWRDLDAGLREARRTLKRGGRAAFVDVYAPGQALFDTHLQAVELLRDAGHWQRKIADIAFEIGFKDLSYFNRVFRRKYGGTPTDVRQAAMIEHDRRYGSATDE